MSRRDENSSGKRPNSKSKPSFVDSWGLTDDKEGCSRRVYVKNYPPDTTLLQLQNFFGADKLEGIRMWTDYAFVQLKRPSHYTEAIQKNRSDFRRKSIVIEPWREKGVNRMSKSSKRSSSQERWLEKVDTKRDRGRGRSPARSRSRSTSRDRSISRDRGFSGRGRELPLPEPKPNDADSGYFHFNQNFHSSSALQLLPSFGQSTLPHNRPQFVATLASNAFQRTPMWSRNIPADIQWTAQYVIEQGTARNLSIPQLQNLINYLESEKIFLQTNGSDRHCDILPRPNPTPTVTAIQKAEPILVELSPEKSQLSANNSPEKQQPPSTNPRHRSEVADQTEIEKRERAQAKAIADEIKRICREG